MIEKHAIRKILERLRPKDGPVTGEPTAEEVATICDALLELQRQIDALDRRPAKPF